MKEDNIRVHFEGHKLFKSTDENVSCFGRKRKSSMSNGNVSFFLFENVLVICEKMELPGNDQYVYDAKISFKVTSFF